MSAGTDDEKTWRADFVARHGGVYEHSPWIAERTAERGAAPRRERFADESSFVDALARALAATLAAASDEEKLALVRAHPDLVGRAAIAGELTADSSAEQSSAGLDRCTPEEFARFGELNTAYREKFGFPFVMAVRGRGRREILEAFESRLGNAPETELARALEEIDRIARLRLEAMSAETASGGSGG